MSPILLISDVHCRYEVVNRQIDAAEAQLGRPVECVLSLGDLGLFGPQLRRYFHRRGQRFRRPLYTIEGNHEDFRRLETLAAEYAEFFTYLPRGTVHCIGGHRVLALGGSAYMDAASTPRPAEISPRDIDRALGHSPEEVDLVLSHDCPRGIGVPNSPGFEHYGPTGFEGGLRLAQHLRPRLWLFGHHHKWFDRTLDGVRYCGLGPSWTGYGLLEPEGDFTACPNEVSRERSWSERLLGG